MEAHRLPFCPPHSAGVEEIGCLSVLSFPFDWRKDFGQIIVFPVYFNGDMRHEELRSFCVFLVGKEPAIRKEDRVLSDKLNTS